MESESTISKLNSYKQLVEENALNDFTDYLISQKIIKEADYFKIWNYNVSGDIILGYVSKISFCFRVQRLNYMKYIKL